MRPRDKARLRAFWLTRAIYFGQNPVIIGGHKVSVRPSFAKPRDPMFPVKPVKVVVISPYLVRTSMVDEGRGTHNVIFLPTERQITLNPYRLQYGEVGKSKARPSELVRKDVERHLRNTRPAKGSGIVIDHTDPEHALSCIAPHAAR